MSTEQLPDGLQLAVNIIREAEWPEGAGGNPLDAVLNEHARRLTLQHHAADQVWRIADLECRISSLISESEAKIPAMQAAFEERLVLDRANRMLVAKNADLEAERDELIDQRDRGDAQNDMLLAELRQVNTERDELRARLAEIEAQEPVAISKAGNPQDWRGVDCSLYATHVPARAVPMSDERIDAIAELVIKGMPDGICGFVRGWGWQHFARELLDVCAGHYRAGPTQAVLLTDAEALAALPDCHGSSLGKSWLLAAARAIETAALAKNGLEVCRG